MVVRWILKICDESVTVLCMFLLYEGEHMSCVNGVLAIDIAEIANWVRMHPEVPAV